MTSGVTWTAWNIRIGTRAFKEIRPLQIELKKTYQKNRISGFWIFSRYEYIEDGGGEIELIYDMGPPTVIPKWRKMIASIKFDTYAEAEYEFNYIYSKVFIGDDHTPPQPPNKKKKKSHLSIVKDEI